MRSAKIDDASPHVIVRFGSKDKRTKSGKTRRVPLFAVVAAMTGKEIAEERAKEAKRELRKNGPFARPPRDAVHAV